jgi:lipid II:glycine glycyltransferase (peptidoglycan interpeptide bridge formation enzyme)
MEALFSRLDSSVRRAIRKSEKSGLTIQVERSAGAVAEFLSLHARTRKRHGVPPQPGVFFRQIHEQIIQAGDGFVVLARDGGTAVAAAIFFVWREKAIYKFGASNETKQSLRGNNLVMWEAIRFLAESGVKQLDFGRTDLEHGGLRRFKLGWGTAETPISYDRLETESQAWGSVIPRRTGVSAHLFSRLPAIVNRLAGRVLYPHLD